MEQELISLQKAIYQIYRLSVKFVNIFFSQNFVLFLCRLFFCRHELTVSVIRAHAPAVRSGGTRCRSFSGSRSRTRVLASTGPLYGLSTGLICGAEGERGETLLFKEINVLVRQSVSTTYEHVLVLEYVCTCGRTRVHLAKIRRRMGTRPITIAAVYRFFPAVHAHGNFCGMARQPVVAPGPLVRFGAVAVAPV